MRSEIAWSTFVHSSFRFARACTVAGQHVAIRSVILQDDTSS